MKHERSIVSLKQIHHHALKDLSEALEQKLSRSKDISEALWAKLSTSKDISEAHTIFLTKSNSYMALSKGVYSKDDCGKLTSKDANNTRRSKQNT